MTYRTKLTATSFIIERLQFEIENCLVRQYTVYPIDISFERLNAENKVIQTTVETLIF